MKTAPLVVVFVLLMTVAAHASSHRHPVAREPVPSNPAGSAPPVAVESGTWEARDWTFKARDTVKRGVVDYCWFMSFAHTYAGLGSGCAGFLVSRISVNGMIAPFGMDVQDLSSRCPGLAHVDGAVVASAKSVSITLSTGAVVRTPSIAPPAGLPRGVRFFMARMPCGTRPETAVAHNAAGKVVASTRPQPPVSMA